MLTLYDPTEIFHFSMLLLEILNEWDLFLFMLVIFVFY